MAQNLKAYLEKLGGWEDLDRRAQSYFEKIDASWDDLIIQKIDEVVAGGANELDLAGIINQVLGDKNPFVPASAPVEEKVAETQPPASLPVEEQPAATEPEKPQKAEFVEQKREEKTEKPPKAEQAEQPKGKQKQKQKRASGERFEGIRNFFGNMRERMSGGISNVHMPEFDTGSTLTIIKFLLIALVVFGGGYFIYNSGWQPSAVSGVAPESGEFFNVPQPTLIPLDFIHSTQPGINQVIIGLCTFLVIVLVLMDSMQRREKSDFRLMIAALVFMLIAGVVFTLTKDSFFVGVMHFDPGQLKFVQRLYGFAFTALAFNQVYLVSVQGRKDWTPLGGFLSIIGASGMLFGTIGLGSIGILLTLPDSPTLPVVTLWSMFWHKQFAQMSTSLVIYVISIAGTFTLGREAYRSIRSARPGTEKIMTTLGSTMLITGYFVGRYMFPSFHPVLIFLAALGISGMLGLQNQQEGHESEDKGYAGSAVSVGEVREGRALVPPYDKLAWQVAGILTVIVFIGHI